MTHAKRTQFRVAPGGEIEALAMPEADSETSLTRRDQAWFNSRILAGDKSGVAGVELATASEPPARRPRIWGRRPQPPLSCDLRLNHAEILVELVPTPSGE